MSSLSLSSESKSIASPINSIVDLIISFFSLKFIFQQNHMNLFMSLFLLCFFAPKAVNVKIKKIKVINKSEKLPKKLSFVNIKASSKENCEKVAQL